MRSKEASQQVRSAFGAFFRGKKDSVRPPLPPIFNNISINISHTFQTRMRVRLMKEIARQHKGSNPELDTFVTGFLPRPVLRIRPPVGRVESFTFVEAICRFSHYFSPDFLKAEATYAKTGMPLESLESCLIVLTPDLILPSILHTPAADRPRTRAAGSTQSDQPTQGTSGKRTHSEAFVEVAALKNKPKKNKGKGKGSGQSQTEKQAAPSTTVSTSNVPTANRYDALGTPISATLDRTFVATADSQSEEEETDDGRLESMIRRSPSTKTCWSNTLITYMPHSLFLLSVLIKI